MPAVVRSAVTSMPVITAKRRVPSASKTMLLFHTTRSRSPSAVPMSASRWPGIREPSVPANISRTMPARSGRVNPSHSGAPDDLVLEEAREPEGGRVRAHDGAVERGHDDDRVRGVQRDVGELALLGEPVQQLGALGDGQGERQRHQGGAHQVGLHQRAGHRAVDELAADADGERPATAGGQERGEDAQRQQLSGDHRGPEPQACPDQQRQRQERQRQLLLGPEDGQRDAGEQEGLEHQLGAVAHGRLLVPDQRERDDDQGRGEVRGHHGPGGLEGIAPGDRHGHPDAEADGHGPEHAGGREPEEVVGRLHPRALVAAPPEERGGHEGLGGVRDAEQHGELERSGRR